ncbi:MAG: ABC transporter permease, partial [Anaerolineaceae bacterium]|nr:ABC transporter permease [Anaerolineaceae bacterium]
MNIAQGILEALESLSANKTRSALTILGIVIGVAAVIAMLAVGSGAQNVITGSISGIGTNLLFVFSGNFQEEVRNPKPLTIGDSEAIGDVFQAPSVAAVAPVIQGNREATFGRERANTTINGVTPEYYY